MPRAPQLRFCLRSYMLPACGHPGLLTLKQPLLYFPTLSLEQLTRRILTSDWPAYAYARGVSAIETR